MKHTKGSSVIREFKQALDSLDIRANACPSLTLMVGRKAKSEVLRRFLPSTSRDLLIDSHSQVHVWNDPQTGQDMMYVDFELQAYETPRKDQDDNAGPTVLRVADWLGSARGSFTRRRVGNLISGRAIAPLCHTVCYFASDLGGTRGVATLIAQLLAESPASDLPYECLPRILVIVDTASEIFDCRTAEDTLFQAICDSAAATTEVKDGLEVQRRLKLHFHHIQVIGIRTTHSIQKRANQIRNRLVVMKR